MTRPAEATDATKGACALALSQRATSKVDTLTRTSDPFAQPNGLTHQTTL